jgi:hypothetical protein
LSLVRRLVIDDENRLASLTAVEVQVDADERGRYPSNVARAAMPRMNPGSDVGTGRKRLQGAAARWKRWEMSRQRLTNDGVRPGRLARPGMWEGGYLGSVRGVCRL